MHQDAYKFIELLSGGDSCTYQTFDDDRKLKRKNLIKIIHGRLEDHIRQLEKLNNQGAGIFVMVNTGDLKGRASKNVLSVRAAFVDLDGSPIQPVLDGPLKPHIVVESSPGKYHAYWLVDGIELTAFKAVQQSLALRFNADPSVCDLPRVLRLPGFNHNKKTPTLTKILETNDIPKYSSEEFYKAFEIDLNVTNWKSEDLIFEGSRNNKLFSQAIGFVNQGLDPSLILERIKVINHKRCSPSLPEEEVISIVSNALNYPANGSVSVSYEIFDSPKYRKLSCNAKVLDLFARRVAKNKTESEISLTAKDLACIGLGNPRTLAAAKKELVAAGYIIEIRSPQYKVKGVNKVCGLFRLAAG